MNVPRAAQAMSLWDDGYSMGYEAALCEARDAVAAQHKEVQDWINAGGNPRHNHEARAVLHNLERVITAIDALREEQK